MTEPSETIIRIEDVNKLQKDLATHRAKRSGWRFLKTLGLASFFLLIPIVRPEDTTFRDYFWNVSAGAYGAAILYALIEKDFAEKQDQETTLTKLAVLTERIVEYGQKVQTKYLQVTRMQKNIDSLTKALETKKYGNSLEIEYSLWKLRPELMWNIDELIHLMKQRNWVIEQVNSILIEFDYPSERDRLLAVERRNAHEMEQMNTLLENVTKEYAEQTLKLNKRFVSEELGNE